MVTNVIELIAGLACSSGGCNDSDRGIVNVDSPHSAARKTAGYFGGSSTTDDHNLGTCAC